MQHDIVVKKLILTPRVAGKYCDLVAALFCDSNKFDSAKEHVQSSE